MTKMVHRPMLALLALAIAAFSSACGGSGETQGTGGSGGSAGSGGSGGVGGVGGGTGGQVQAETVTVSGTVVDFETAAAVDGSATLTATGLMPAPTISVTGADFEVSGIAPYSVFYMLAGAPPSYHNTYGEATAVEAADVAGIKLPVVAESFLTKLSNGFGTISTPGTGMVLLRVVDAAGNPKAGVPASAFSVNGAAPPKAPRFLDEMLNPATFLNETSGSGYVVFYDVPEGLATIGALDGSGYGISGPQIPSAANVVSLARAEATDGPPMLPKNVSFSTQIVPIFSQRGCQVCHSGNSPGADLGNLSLNGSDNSIYKELTQEISQNFGTKRVDLMSPEKSLILTMPSAEDPPDPHPNATFASASDPDYLLLLGWITEGALQN